MRSLIEEDFDKIVLVSGDGDYFRTVKYLLQKQRLLKILLPSRKSASSLYSQIGGQHWTNLDRDHVRKKVEYKKEKGKLGH